MIDWLIGNISTILVSLILIGLVTIVIRKIIKDKKRGITSCGTSCNGCAMSGSCKDFQKKN
jgi:hypothetical protein